MKYEVIIETLKWLTNTHCKCFRRCHVQEAQNYNSQILWELGIWMRFRFCLSDALRDNLNCQGREVEFEPPCCWPRQPQKQHASGSSSYGTSFSCLNSLWGAKAMAPSVARSLVWFEEHLRKLGLEFASSAFLIIQCYLCLFIYLLFIQLERMSLSPVTISTITSMARRGNNTEKSTVGPRTGVQKGSNNSS